MTIQQIKLVVEIAARRSVSDAAESMNIAQSNASQAVKKLEEELGYKIFKRGSGRISPTEEGYSFIDHAEILLREQQAIVSLKKEESEVRLRLGTTNFSAPIDAFVRFCDENKDKKCADLACVNTSAQEGAIKLRERTLDIVITFFTKQSLASAEHMCRENKLSLIRLAQLPFCVRVRKDHPLLVNGTLDGTNKGFAKLANYPYVGYSNTKELIPRYNSTSDLPFGCKYHIFVEERDTRLRINGTTDAYSLGRMLTKNTLDEYGLTAVPIRDELVTLAAILRKGDEKLTDICHYQDLLMEELAKAEV